jgi:hypothetical protein
MGALPTFVPLMKAQSVRHLVREIREDELIQKARPRFPYEKSKPRPIRPAHFDMKVKPRDYICVVPEPEEEKPQYQHTPMWRIIVREVCQKHGVPEIDIFSHRRPHNVVLARHEMMYRMRHETPLSLPQIGKRLGGRDHTTVLHGIRKHQARLEAMNAQ